MTGRPIVTACFYRVGPVMGSPAFPSVRMERDGSLTAYGRHGDPIVAGAVGPWDWPVRPPKAPDGPVWRLRVTAYRTRWRGRWRIASQTLEPYSTQTDR